MNVVQRNQGGIVQALAQVLSIPSETHIADYTVLASDAGKLLIANDDTNVLIFTLPAVTVKGVWWFADLGQYGMRIVGGTADKMVVFNDAAADSVGYETGGEMIGAACFIICDGTNYYHFDCSNEAVTVTIVTN